MSKTKHTIFSWGTLVLFALTLILGGLIQNSFSGGRQSYAEDDNRASAARKAISHAGALSEAFRYVADSVRPSVVSIRSVQKAHVARRSRRSNPQIPDELRRFFGDEDIFGRSFDFQIPEGGVLQQGMGSGVIISIEGYVLTNYHVVRRADEIEVTLADGRQLAAKIVGSDPKTDLAILKINARGLRAARMGDSKSVHVGEWVLAIGSPFSYDQTVTAGIVSAKGRTVGVLQDIHGYEDFIQTDAAINPGNSGGPLVNLQGEVIGINTAIASRSGGFNGLGFAIPSNMAQDVTDAIVKDGRVQRGKLGVIVADLNEDMARTFGLDSSKGVLVNHVLEDSSAERVGLRAGDIIVRLNGESVEDMRQLRHTIAATEPGTRVDLGVYRNGRERTIKLVVDELEDKPLAETSEIESSDKLGLSIETMTDEHARQLGVDADYGGVVVMGVEPGSIAARAGLRRGVVIVKVDKNPVKTTNEFREAIRTHDLRDGVRIQIIDRGIYQFGLLKDRS